MRAFNDKSSSGRCKGGYLKMKKGLSILWAFCVLFIFQFLIGQAETKIQAGPFDASQSFKDLSDRSKVDAHVKLKDEIGKFVPTFYQILNTPPSTCPPPPATLQ